MDSNNMMDSDTFGFNFDSQIEILQSIYPELRLVDGRLIMEVEMSSRRSVPIRFKNKSFNCTYFDPILFEMEIPLQKVGFVIKSSWVRKELIEALSQEISRMIDESPEEMLMFNVCDFLANGIMEKYEEQIFQIEVDCEQDYNKLMQMNKILRLENFGKTRFKCSICLDDKDGAQGILLDCNHKFCEDCLKQYIIMTTNLDVSKLQCPNCPIITLKNLQTKSPLELKELVFKEKFELQVITNLLDADFAKKFSLMLNNKNFEIFSSYYPFSCSKCPRCNTWLMRADVDNKLMICHACKLAYCFDCNHSWHGTTNYCGLKLNTIPSTVLQQMTDESTSIITREKYFQIYGRNSLRIAVDQYVADRIFDETVENDDNLIKCPKCQTVITKSDGCNKMKCFVCSCMFCYLCGSELEPHDPYSHFTNLKSLCYGRLFEGMPGTEDLT